MVDHATRNAADDQGPQSPVSSTERQTLVDAAPASPAAARAENHFDKWFDWIPEQYRVGPWSPVAYVFLVAWPLSLAFAGPRMQYSYESEMQNAVVVPGTLQFWLAVAGAAWTVLLNVHMIRAWSLYPFCSFTLLSWCMLTGRFLCVALSPYSPAALALAEVLRFPTLSGAAITTVVWNLFLQFLIYFLMPTDKQRKQFVKFNLQFSLINIHVLNLPLAYLSHYCSPRPLVFFDFWVSNSWFFLYALFYLTVLDSRGIHMYPVFTPRTHLCFVSYGAIIGLSGLVYLGWRAVLG